MGWLVRWLVYSAVSLLVVLFIMFTDLLNEPRVPEHPRTAPCSESASGVELVVQTATTPQEIEGSVDWAITLSQYMIVFNGASCFNRANHRFFSSMYIPVDFLFSFWECFWVITAEVHATHVCCLHTIYTAISTQLRQAHPASVLMFSPIER